MDQELSTVKPSVPEPPPINVGLPVTPALLYYIQDTVDHSLDGVRRVKFVSDLVKSRDAYGFEKYGQHLMSEDGRCTMKDAKDELADFMQYAFKLKMQDTATREDVEELRALVDFAERIVNGIDNQVTYRQKKV